MNSIIRTIKKIILGGLFVIWSVSFSVTHAQETSSFPKAIGTIDVSTTVDSITKKSEPFRIQLLEKVKIEKEKVTQKDKEESSKEKTENYTTHLSYLLLLYILSIALFILEHAWLFYSIVVICLLLILSVFFK